MSDLTQIVVTLISTTGTILTAWMGYKATVESNKQKKELKTDESEEKKKVVASQVKSLDQWKRIWIGTFILFAVITVLTYFLYFQNDAKDENQLETISAPIIGKIKEGLNNNDEYILPTVLMHVVLDSVKDSLRANITMIYNVLQVAPAKLQTKTFNDSYKLNRGGRFVNLIGSDSVRQYTEDWSFRYETAPGVQRTTVSQFEVRYPSILGSYTPFFFSQLSYNEEVFEYHNEDNNAIGEVTIMVSSSILKFQNPSANDAAIGLPRTEGRERYLPTIFRSENGSSNTIIARFRNIKSQEHAQLKVAWH